MRKFIGYILLLVAFLLLGCAAHKPPKVGAPPEWKPETPFGGHWDCHSDKYQYNPETQHCELKGQ